MAGKREVSTSRKKRRKSRKIWSRAKLRELELGIVFSWEFLEGLGFKPENRRGMITRIGQSFFFGNEKTYQEFRELQNKSYAQPKEGEERITREHLTDFIAKHRITTLDQLLKSKGLYAVDEGYSFESFGRGYRRYTRYILEFLGYTTHEHKELEPKEIKRNKIEKALKVVLGAGAS